MASGKHSNQGAKEPPATSRRDEPKTRNWVWLDADQQQRFLRLQKKKGLDGPSLLSMIFNEYADKEGL